MEAVSANAVMTSSSGPGTHWDDTNGFKPEVVGCLVTLVVLYSKHNLCLPTCLERYGATNHIFNGKYNNDVRKLFERP